MEKIWHCFQVSDYKGGELHSEINLTVEELLSVISNESSSPIDTYTDEELKTLLESGSDKELAEVFNSWYDAKCDDNGLYAGYSGCTTHEIYTTSPEGHLSSDFPNEKEIADFTKEMIREYLDNEGLL